MRVNLKNHRFWQYKIIGCPNHLKLGFYEIEQKLMNFSRLGPLTNRKMDYYLIKNCFSSKLFKKHKTQISEQYFETPRQHNFPKIGVTLKNHRFWQFKILCCPNHLKPGFYEIEQHLVNFSRLDPLTSLKVDNYQIKNISSRKLFIENHIRIPN